MDDKKQTIFYMMSGTDYKRRDQQKKRRTRPHVRRPVQFAAWTTEVASKAGDYRERTEFRDFMCFLEAMPVSLAWQ